MEVGDSSVGLSDIWAGSSSVGAAFVTGAGVGLSRDVAAQSLASGCKLNEPTVHQDRLG